MQLNAKHLYATGNALLIKTVAAVNDDFPMRLKFIDGCLGKGCGAQNIMADKGTNYRTMLADVADELTDDDAKALAFELVIPRGERDKIINGRTLIDVMEKNELISGNNVDQLLKILKNRRHNVAATKLEDYKKNHITSPESESGDMLPKDKRVEESYLETLSEQFTREWKDVGRGLGIKDPQLESILADNPMRRKDAILEMLKYWWRKNGKEATYAVLAEAFKKAHRVDLQEEVLNYGKSH